jgi:hypothetical protein
MARVAFARHFSPEHVGTVAMPAFTNVRSAYTACATMSLAGVGSRTT